VEIPAEGKVTAEVNFFASSHVEERMDIEISSDYSSTTIAEKNSGELNVPPVIRDQ
jgi:hypothetical protein